MNVFLIEDLSNTSIFSNANCVILFYEMKQTLKLTLLCVTFLAYFHCYTVHVVELLNYYTNHCTYIKLIKCYTLKH